MDDIFQVWLVNMICLNFFKVGKTLVNYTDMLLWRNWLARSAVNRKAGGSSPPRSVLFLKYNLLKKKISCKISFDRSKNFD